MVWDGPASSSSSLLHLSLRKELPGANMLSLSLERNLCICSLFQRIYTFTNESLIIQINYSVDIHLHSSSAMCFCCQPLELAHLHRDHSQVPTSDHNTLSLLTFAWLANQPSWINQAPLPQLWEKSTEVTGVSDINRKPSRKHGYAPVEFLLPFFHGS